MKNKLLYYFLILLVFVSVGWSVIQFGLQMEVGEVNSHTSQAIGGWHMFKAELLHNLQHPLSLLLVQIAVIIFVARVLGMLMRKIGQPAVIGEILAGIMLGPSLVGMFFPAFSALLFPASSLPNLQILSQIGLVLFMFVIGMELDMTVLKKSVRDALIISHSGIMLSYIFGIILAAFIYTQFAPEGVPFMGFALFMGIAMSITAFPVLARIIQERGLTKTPFGSMIITCAAIDDITAWCLLAFAIAVVKAGNAIGALYVIAAVAVYVAVMWWVVMPFIKKMSVLYPSRETISRPVVAFIFLILIGSAYVTEILGIHALFGAFLAGVVMPQDSKFKHILSEKIEDVSAVLLLPLFFVFTGLRTQIGLLNQPSLWMLCGIVISLAVMGKFLGISLSSKLLGNNWRRSITLGALMNTRGLMELVVLNIGYDLGLLKPEIFAIMVLMALATTCMTGPSLDLINYIFKKRNIQVANSFYNVLISFGPAEMGSTLLKVARAFFKDYNPGVNWTALHLTPNSEISLTDAEYYTQEAFAPIRKTAKEQSVNLQTVYKNSERIAQEIIKTVSEHTTDFLLMGSAKSIFRENVTGGVIEEVMREVNCSVGVFIDRSLTEIQKVLFVFHSEEDAHLLMPLKYLLYNSAIQSVCVSDKDAIFNEQMPDADKLSVLEAPQHPAQVATNFDLIVVSLNFWKWAESHAQEWLQTGPSVLIIKNKNG